MALVSGAGNPVGGSNPSGTSQGLNYLGDHAYAFNQVAVTDSETTFFEFTSGFDSYVVSGLQIINYSNSADDMQYKVYLNEELIASWLPPTSTNLQEPPQPLQLLIPPSTKVKITGTNTGSSAGRNHTANIVGRVYA